MKHILIITLCCAPMSQSFNTPLEWSRAEMEQANTAKDISYLNAKEKEVIMFMNLARMFPQRYLEIEARHWEYGRSNNYYWRTLKRDLDALTPLAPLQADAGMTDEANCHARSMYRFRFSNHGRKFCPANYNAECLSFGDFSARQHVFNLLLDEDVRSLGHRKIILSDMIKKAGVASYQHRKFTESVTIDFL